MAQSGHVYAGEAENLVAAPRKEAQQSEPVLIAWKLPVQCLVSDPC